MIMISNNNMIYVTSRLLTILLILILSMCDFIILSGHHVRIPRRKRSPSKNILKQTTNKLSMCIDNTM